MYILGIILILIMLFGKNKILLYFKINSEIYMINLISELKYKLGLLTIDTSYKLLYCFSWCQLYSYKVKDYIRPKLKYINSCCDKYLKDKGWIIESSHRQLIIIDSNGNEIQNIYIENEDNIKFIENKCNKLNYSGLILLDHLDYESRVNYVFYEKFPNSFDYKVSNVKFIAIDLNFNNKNYLINLKDSNYNYYIVNNSLNIFFFKYYIKNILKIDFKDDDFDYSVNIIDNDVNMINLLPYQSIIINENDYKIYPVENKKCDNENFIDDEIVIYDKISNSGSDSSDDYVNLETIK
jgi:hypothetical protein